MAPLLVAGGVGALLLLSWLWKSKPVAEPVLDEGLTPREADAVAVALARETSPENLDAFASTFDAVAYPLTTTALRVRASELRS